MPKYPYSGASVTTGIDLRDLRRRHDNLPHIEAGTLRTRLYRCNDREELENIKARIAEIELHDYEREDLDSSVNKTEIRIRINELREANDDEVLDASVHSTGEVKDYALRLREMRDVDKKWRDMASTRSRSNIALGVAITGLIISIAIPLIKFLIEK